MKMRKLKMKKNENVTTNCRYIDGRRRTVIPMNIISAADIHLNSVIEWTACNGCLVGRPVVGITVPDLFANGKRVRKGR